MTVSLILRVNGNYVATAKMGSQEISVGPGVNNKQAEKHLHFAHGQGPQSFSVDERPATPEEIEAASSAE